MKRYVWIKSSDIKLLSNILTLFLLLGLNRIKHINITFIFIIIIIIELTHSKTILENTVEIEPQPVALDFKNFSQYSSRSK